LSKEKKDRQYQKGLIITDDVAIEPILDFDLYRNAIANIIKNSYPKFTIGIFGDWGTGKTTLMNAIYEILEENKNDIVRVRFEAWRYEREEQFALIPLLKTIAFALPEEEKFKNLKRKLKRGAINFIKKTPDIISSIISKNINEEAGIITKEAFNSFKNEFNSKMELLAEVDRDTLYFDGFDDIKNEINKIQTDNPNFKIVVFVDDLDRCSPTKALEVLESIKVFLGMEGFIYIIGLSHDIVTKLIDIEYEKKGVKGEQYIKKIIQIPVTLPKWNFSDVAELVKHFIDKGLIHDKYRNIIKQNLHLVTTATENNPREIKRFLNNFIIAYEIFNGTKDFKATELLLIQAIQLRWNNFYNLLITSDKNFLNEINKYLKMNEFTRSSILNSFGGINKNDYDPRIREILKQFNNELWVFLSHNFDRLYNIKNWNIYRRATEIGNESFPKLKENNDTKNLLKHRKLNDILLGRIKGDFSTLDLRASNLIGANLTGHDLTNVLLNESDLRNIYYQFGILSGSDLTNTILANAYLKDAKLNDTKLTNADLSNAILDETDLSNADLRNATLINAQLTGAYLGPNLDRSDKTTNLNGANLNGANLNGAKLEGAYLIKVSFDSTNLKNTDLSNSIICLPENYTSLILNENTNFNNSIIDDSEFINYIDKFTRNVPQHITNKKDLEDKLKTKLNDKLLNFILVSSKLPK
jgi:uncharacterized protein YjbI with pentapeptide repeats